MKRTKLPIHLHTKPDYLFSGHTLAALIAPLIIDLFLTFFVGMLDSIMVSTVDESAVSGISLVDQVVQLVIMVFSAMATGGAVVCGQYLGAKKRDKACEASTQLVWLMFLCGIGVAIAVFLLRHLILQHVFGKITDQVYAYADKYMILCSLSIPMLAVHQAGTAVFRTMGNSKNPMWISLMMNIINFGGNAALIYGAGMDTDGAGISTLASRTAAALIVTLMLLDRRRTLHYLRSRFRPVGSLIRRILYVAIPNGLENGMFQLGKIALLSLVSTYGTNAITANAITQNMAQIQLIPAMAVNMAVTTVISRCVGYGDVQQVRYYNQLLLKIMYLATLLISYLVFFAMPWILILYHATPPTCHLTMLMMRWHTFGAISLWPLAFEFPQALRAAGDVTFPMITSIITMWCVRIMGAYLLARVFGMGALSPWIAMVMDFVVRTVIFQLQWRSGRWTNKKVI